MEKSILFTGGARSGKSVLAERKALQASGRAFYIATARVWHNDPEMAERIAAHKVRRGTGWEDVYAPVDLARALNHTNDTGLPRLVDCLTLWLTNVMMDELDWRRETDALVATIAAQSAPVIFVTNEVGLGIVPDNKLARAFRDAAGYVNQSVAEVCDTVWLVVAGCPIKVKPSEHSF